MKTTERLEQSLRSAEDLPEYIRENELVLNGDLTLGSYVSGFLAQKKMSRYRLFRKADITSSFGYEMLNGKRLPDRDTLLRFAFLLQLSIEQTQKMLNLAETSLLYPRRLRDSVILFFLRDRKTIAEVNAMLREHDLEPI